MFYCVMIGDHTFVVMFITTFRALVSTKNCAVKVGLLADYFLQKYRIEDNSVSLNCKDDPIL